MESVVNKHSKQHEEATQEEAFVTPSQLLKTIEMQRFRCALSGVPLNPSNCDVDHIDPLSKGGSDMIDNIQILHRTVNRMKGTLSQSEFVEWCRLIVKHAEKT